MLGQLVDDYLLDFDIFHVSHVTGNHPFSVKLVTYSIDAVISKLCLMSPVTNLSTRQLKIPKNHTSLSELLHYIEPKYLSGNSTQCNPM